MFLENLTLHNFRSYTKSFFTFDPQTTVIVGQNGSGKTNLLEAVLLLGTGKSKKAEKDKQLIRFGEVTCHVIGKSIIDMEEKVLEVLLTENSGNVVHKKYRVNGVPKRRI